MARVRSRTGACEICGVQGCTGTGFSPALSFPCQYKPPTLHVGLNRSSGVPRNFVGGGGSTNSVEDRENGDLGAIAP